jgi:hypothetical protein
MNEEIYVRVPIAYKAAIQCVWTFFFPDINLIELGGESWRI